MPDSYLEVTIRDAKPPNPAVGDIYFDRKDKVLKMYTGTDWTTMVADEDDVIIVDDPIAYINKIPLKDFNKKVTL